VVDAKGAVQQAQQPALYQAPYPALFDQAGGTVSCTRLSIQQYTTKQGVRCVEPGSISITTRPSMEYGTLYQAQYPAPHSPAGSTVRCTRLSIHHYAIKHNEVLMGVLC
jgi:hypothetical protein